MYAISNTQVAKINCPNDVKSLFPRKEGQTRSNYNTQIQMIWHWVKDKKATLAIDRKAREVRGEIVRTPLTSEEKTAKILSKMKKKDLLEVNRALQAEINALKAKYEAKPVEKKVTKRGRPKKQTFMTETPKVGKTLLEIKF